jgi:malonyl CoA-acyl carrier protein transacylase
MALGFSLPALAAQTVSQEAPSADACTKTVNAMGAAMGHRAETAPDGRPMYRFTLRTNGLDYDVMCDAKSGVVSDVTPRMAH